jgi:hypothetical protein
MDHWTFEHFHDDRRIDLIEAWLAGLPVEARARIERRFAYLATIKDKAGWKKPFAAKLQGLKKGNSIYEIRIAGNNVLYRPLGCFGPKEEEEFTLLIGAFEKGKGVFEPRRAPDTAITRCKLIHQDRRYVGEYD